MTETREYVLNEQEFVEGVMMALWETGHRQFNVRQRTSDGLDIAFDLSMEQASGRLPELLGDDPMDLRFSIRCHAIHGDSLTVQAAVRYEAWMGSVRYEDGHWVVLTYSAEFIRLRRTPGPMAVELDREQIDPEIFRTLARGFVADYLLPRECRRYVRQVVETGDLIGRHLLKVLRDDGTAVQLADL
jgi:hypothetical protein